MSHRFRVVHGDTELTADTAVDGGVVVDGRRFRVVRTSSGQYRVTDDHGLSMLVAVAGPPHATWVSVNGRTGMLVVDASPKRPAASRAAVSDMAAPMPATVVKLVVAVGERVEAGAAIVVLEAMKMEFTVRAARDGVVRALGCAVGDLVTPGVPLVEIDA